ESPVAGPGSLLRGGGLSGASRASLEGASTRAVVPHKARVLQPRQTHNGGAEPLTSRRRQHPATAVPVIATLGPSGGWGSARVQGLVRKGRDPSVQPCQQRPRV